MSTTTEPTSPPSEPADNADGALVAQRAILYEEGESTSAPGSAFKGTVVWQVVEEGSGSTGPILRAFIAWYSELTRVIREDFSLSDPDVR